MNIIGHECVIWLSATLQAYKVKALLYAFKELEWEELDALYTLVTCDINALCIKVLNVSVPTKMMVDHLAAIRHVRWFEENAGHVRWAPLLLY